VPGAKPAAAWGLERNASTLQRRVGFSSAAARSDGAAALRLMLLPLPLPLPLLF
jgi:hypothetical protein